MYKNSNKIYVTKLCVLCYEEILNNTFLKCPAKNVLLSTFKLVWNTELHVLETTIMKKYNSVSLTQQSVFQMPSCLRKQAALWRHRIAAIS